MIFKDLTHSNAPTWGAVGTAVVRFPERLQKRRQVAEGAGCYTTGQAF